jgi:hypothetical protein
MLNKEQAAVLAPIINSKEWPNLMEYLNSLRELTIKGMVMAQSESELRQLQGKLGLLEMLLKLKNSHGDVIKNG